MHRPVFVLACVAVLAVLVGSPETSFAQRRNRDQAQRASDGLTPAQRAQAREAYARGQELFRNGQYEEAETAFNEAYAIQPNPVVLLGIAEARERKQDFPGTIEMLERYLGERADAPDRRQIEQRISDIRARPATLVITSMPAGAAVTIDGQSNNWTTPTEIQVSPGEHTVAIALSGYEAVTRTVQPTFAQRLELEMPLTAVTMAPPANESLEPPAAVTDDASLEGDDHADADAAYRVHEEEDSGQPSGGVWVAAGIGGAALVTGTVLGFLALDEQSDYEDSPSEKTADRGERYALFADVAFGVAAASMITAVVLYVTDSESDEEEETTSSSQRRPGSRVELTPVLGPTGGGVGARVQF